MNLQRTPLYNEHVKAHGRMVPFAGWEMPVQYKGVSEEHLQVRKAVGLFDVSHMGEIRLKGPKALETLQWLTTNDVAKLQTGQAHYSLLPNEKGGLVDDIIVYCLERDHDYLVCVNAANTEKDWQWMQTHNRGAELTNESSQWGQIAVQGPQAMELLSRVFGPSVKGLPSFHVAPMSFDGASCLVAHTGYTGEDGCEIFVPSAQTVALWQKLLEIGEPLGVQPIGLAARDTLRLEMKYSLYGNDIDDEANAYEAGLGWVVKPQSKNFMAKEIILRGKTEPRRKLIGLELIDKGIPRAGYELYSFDNVKIGKVTSGTMSPSLQKPIGIAWVDVAFADLGKEFLVEIRGKKLKAKVVKTPFVNKE